MPTGHSGVDFEPGYTNNQIVSSGFSYDTNGNLKGDLIHTYNTWDAEGKLVSVTSGSNTLILTYDALGRMVEQQKNNDASCSTASDCTSVVYAPTGDKLALMNVVSGVQSLVKAFVPLPGGATAVYNSSGLAYYRHSDWLGSSRLTSSPAAPTKWLYDGAYAPFGESYGEATNTGGTIDHSFTGQNEDTASGLDDFMFREYSSSQQGRWIRPDPAGLAAVALANPQSWNRYEYALNMPCEFRDWLGLCTLNFALTGSQLSQLSQSTIDELKTTITSIFGNAGVDVSFSGTTADYSIDITSAMNIFLPDDSGLMGYSGPGTGNSVLIPYDNVSLPTGLALGRLASHELGHKLVPQSGHSIAGIMMSGSKLGTSLNDPNSQLFTFLPNQSEAIAAACKVLHPDNNGGGGGSEGDFGGYPNSDPFGPTVNLNPIGLLSPCVDDCPPDEKKE